MEGNACYKFSTIRNYIALASARPLRVALDVGANVGAVTNELAGYFPDCRVYAFEAVEEYYRCAVAATRHLPQVTVFNVAVTSQHRYADECGRGVRGAAEPLRVFKGLPAAGPGWIGGSQVLPGETRCDENAFEPLPQRVVPLTLDEVATVILKLEGATEIDLVKFDCEGCERSSLGCAERETLKKLRFIVGEYHDIERFFKVVEEKLFDTHYVSLIGDAHLGAFFAENKDEGRATRRRCR